MKNSLSVLKVVRNLPELYAQGWNAKALTILAIVCLGWTFPAHAAYLSGDGSCSNQEDGVAIKSPWANLSAGTPVGRTASQSPFTNVFSDNAMGAYMDSAGNRAIAQTLASRITSNTAGLVYMNADFMCLTSSGDPFSLMLSGNTGAGDNAAIVRVVSDQLYLESSAGYGAAICTVQTGVWYNVQLTLNMINNTYSGMVVNANKSEGYPVSTRSFITAGIGVIFIMCWANGNIGGRFDNWVLSSDALPAPPHTTCLSSDGDFGRQADGVAIKSPWANLSAGTPVGSTASQSPFTNVYANNTMGAYLDSAGNRAIAQTLASRITSNTAGLVYMNADLMYLTSSGSPFSLILAGNTSATEQSAVVKVVSDQLYLVSGAGDSTAICSVQTGVWYNVQLALNMINNTYSGLVVNASTSEGFPVSPRPFITADIGIIFIMCWANGNIGGRVDNWVLSSDALPAPPYISGDVHYVAQAGQTPSGKYLSWATAASNIQDAISVADIGHAVVVSNGVYDAGGVLGYGGMMTNRIYINKAITVRSANNDPANTIIKGATDSGSNGPAAVRCAYMTAGSLIGFTLTNGATRNSTSFTYDNVAGGLFCENETPVASNCVITCNQSGSCGGGTYLGSLYNCRIVGNSTVGFNPAGGGGARGGRLINCTIASNSTSLVDGYFGGGVYNATVVSNCTIVGNRAGDGGGTSGSAVYNSLIAGNYAKRISGGALFGSLYNCTIVGNQADGGGAAPGGIYESTIINSVIYFNNSAGAYPDLNWSDPLNYLTNCCAPSAPATNGNISFDPHFVSNGSGYGTNLILGDYHLTGNSPCINTGTNQTWWMTVDLDGQPRIRYGTVDMGAYEFLRHGAVFGFR